MLIDNISTELLNQLENKSVYQWMDGSYACRYEEGIADNIPQCNAR